MSNRSFHARNFLGGLIGGIAGILAFGSFGLWVGLIAMIGCACLGFLLGFYLQDMPKLARQSANATKEAFFSVFIVVMVIVFGAGNILNQIRAALYVGLIAGLGFSIWSVPAMMDSATITADSAPAFMAFAAALLAGGLPTMAAMFIAAVLMSGEIDKHGSDRIMSAIGLFFMKAFGYFVAGGRMFVSYLLNLKTDKRVRALTAIGLGATLFITLNLSLGLMVSDVMFNGKRWVEKMRFTFSGVEYGYWQDNIDAWQALLFFAFVMGSIMVPMIALSEPSGEEDLTKLQARRLQTRLGHLDRHGIVGYSLRVMIRFFSMQFLAIPVAMAVVFLLVAGVLGGFVIIPPFLFFAFFGRDLPKLNNGRHWAGLLITVTATAATTLLTQDILTGRLLLTVALANGLVCGASSVGLIAFAKWLPTQCMWAATIKVAENRLQPLWAVLEKKGKKVIDPVFNFSMRPLERFYSQPEMGV